MQREIHEVMGKVNQGNYCRMFERFFYVVEGKEG